MPIAFEKVSHVYSTGTPYEFKALDGVDLAFSEGKMTAVIGRTGSGKSTLVQHLNALLLPSEGTVRVLDREITAGSTPKGLKKLRGDVGLIFQFPEYQLFEETVLKDVSFGPKNFGASEEDARKRAKQALRLCGLEEQYDERSPLELSGGQKRRAAIAGVLAMDPKVLVLDEPTAGLDPRGTEEMMKLFRTLNKKNNKTIIIVTHDMEQVFQYCDEVVVMADGKVAAHMSTDEFFADSSVCRGLGILPPAIIRTCDALREAGFDIPKEIRTSAALAKCIAQQVRRYG